MPGKITYSTAKFVSNKGVDVSKAHLVKPSLAQLPAYVAALKQGWSPDNLREAQVAKEHLGQISRDAPRFLKSQDDEGATGDPIQLPDGSFIPRLPSFTRWIWDGEFCGSIELRWQLGSPLLPAHVLGHIGYTIVPWKRGVGHAKQALTCMFANAAWLTSTSQLIRPTSHHRK